MSDPDPTNMVDQRDADVTEQEFGKSIIKFHLIS